MKLKESILKQIEEKVQSILASSLHKIPEDRKQSYKKNVRYIATGWGEAKQRNEELKIELEEAIYKYTEVQKDYQDVQIINLKRSAGIALTDWDQQLMEKYSK